MNANEFNSIYDETITRRLQEHGYYKKGKSLYLQKGTTIAALLRNTFRGDQGVDITFGIRHTFVKDFLNQNTENLYLTNRKDYPFQFSMLEFKESDLFTISPIHWSENVCDYIYYGETDIEQAEVIRSNLEQIYNNVVVFGPKLINLLSPTKSMEILERNNNTAWIERARLEDYKKYLSTNK